MDKKTISIKKLKKKIWFNLFSIVKLPLAFITNLSINEITDELCVTKVKYNYINKNPFKSTYFASLSMAAELATGILTTYHIQNSEKKIAFIVTSMKAEFNKKAKGTTFFRCDQGNEIKKLIKNLNLKDDKGKISLIVNGYNENKETICQFTFEWSLKKQS